MRDCLRIGYIAGQPKRINERAIDRQWVGYLAEHAELAQLPPLSIVRLMGGTTNDWLSRFPRSLDELAEKLGKLCRDYRLDTIYLNLPACIPYLMMARSYAGLNVGFLFLAHSAGSEYWLRQWIAIAPWLTPRDVLLTSTESGRRALLNVSDRYRMASLVRLATNVGAAAPIESLLRERSGKRLLSIGRLEDVKNIHILLECFSDLRRRIPDLRLTVAGEYTGSSAEQMAGYRERLEEIVSRLRLEESVHFAGPVDGEEKEALFRSADLLVNLSTDPGETFGFNLVEAKAWGVPAVCTRWDGFRELISDGEDGCLIDCSWDGDVPVIDREQAVNACLVLQDPEALAARSRRAYESARDFDYRSVFPEIVSAVRNSRRCRVQPVPDAADIALTPPSRLPAYFPEERMAGLPFGHEPLVSIAARISGYPLSSWMPIAKPFIHHFIGRDPYAKL